MLCLKCHRDLEESCFDIKPSTKKLKRFCRPCCREIGRGVSKQRRKRPDSLYGGADYKSRHIILRELGFQTYADYLASDLWKDIRRRVYAIKGSVCYLCDRPATELHHNRYHRNDLTGRRLKFINPICRRCHEGIEFRGNQKSTVKQVSKQFKKRRKARNARSACKMSCVAPSEQPSPAPCP